jgi:spore coat protein U-like protein
MVRIKAAAAPALVLLLAATPARAGLCGTFLDPMSVSANTLVFGNYLASTASASNAKITISCGLLGLDLLPSFTIALSPGSSANAAARTLLFGSKPLSYNVYTAMSYASIWGDGTGGSVTQPYNGPLLQLGNTQFTAFGLIPAGQFVTPGPYTDSMTVTVSF